MMPGGLSKQGRHGVASAQTRKASNGRWLIRHSLRSAVKRGEMGALDLVGFGKTARVSVHNPSITPKRALIGDVAIAFEIVNADSQWQRLLVDFRVHFMNANGKTSQKVFKLKTIELSPQEHLQPGKTISLSDMTTRKHHPGTHRVDVMLNGRAEPVGTFELVEEDTSDFS